MPAPSVMAIIAPRIHVKTRRAIGALLSGEAKNQRHAAEIAGMHDTHLSTALKKPSVREYIASTVRHRLTTVGIMAASRVAEALVETAESEYVRADMAKWLLGVSGVKPESERVTTNVGSVNLTILMGNDKLQVTSQPIDITPSPDLPIPLPEAEG